MKKFFTLIFMVLCAAALFAQAPEKFTYQAVVRNANNTLVANAQVGVRVNILQGTATGNAVYSETHMVSTNANGLVTLNIGAGSVLHGSFANIDWADGPYYLKTDIDPNGGNNYNITSTQQLQSVPYALYAKEASNSFSGDYNDLTNTPQIPTVPANISAFTNDAGYITSYTETDPTVPAWAKEANKPTYSYSEITNTPAIPTVPTNVSVFTNDAGYITMDSIPAIPTIPNVLSAFTNDAGYITLSQVPTQVNSDWNATSGAAQILNKPTLFSGNYNDLSNKPTIPIVPTNVSAFSNDAGYITSAEVQQLANIPTMVSAFQNDAGYVTTSQLNQANYITLSQVPAQVNADWNATSGVAKILNKPTLFSGNYNDLSNKPTIPSVPSNVSAFTNDAGYITLSQVPVQVPSDWNATSGAAQILNKPTLFSGNYNDLSNKPTIPTVPTNVSAFSNDAGYLTAANVQQAANIPTNVSAFTNDAGYVTTNQLNAANYITLSQVPAQVNADWNATSGAAQILNKPTLFSGNYNDLSNKPALATVATTGNYNDLNNKPTIPTVPSNVSVFSNDAHYITEAQLNALLAGMNNTIDSLRDRIHELETNPSTQEPVFAEINTASALYITETTAQSGGNITSDGGSLVSARGICWSTSHNPTIAGNHTYDGSGKGSYVSILSGLTSGTTYYVRAYATNGEGTFYGNEVSFTTPLPFTCGTSTVTDFDGNTYHTVQIGGQCWMKENMRTTHYATGTAITQASGSQYSITDRYYYTVSGGQAYGFLYNWPAVIGPDNVQTNNQGVCPAGWHVPGDGEWRQLTTFVGGQSNYQCSSNSDYYAKSLAAQTGWDNINSSCLPGYNQISNNATGFSALPAGYINETGIYYYSGEQAHFWSASEYSNISSKGCRLSYNGGTMYFTNNGKKCGCSVRCLRDEGVSISLPTLSTNSATLITTTTATSGGHIASTGNSTVTARGVSWSTSHSPTVNDNHTNDGVGTGSFTSYLTGLNPGTTYYVRAYAVNEVGIAYGSEVSFTTSTPAIPTLTTTTVTSITTNTAMSGGNITNSGGNSVTARGVCWSTSHNPTISNNHTTDGTGTGSFTSSLTGLSSGTTYYVRAYAVNSEGTAYGNEVSFTTIAPFVCGTSTVSDYDGNVYNTVQIGSQCWTKENMRATHYSDGTVITKGNTSQVSTSTRYYYNPGSSQAYGYLYNWPATKGPSSVSANNQGVCPTGWHVPSDGEWTQLIQYVGTQSQYVCNSNGDYVAKALASTTGWSSSSYSCNIGGSPSNNNATGFSALPAGYFCLSPPANSGSYDDIGEEASFWTSTASSSTQAYARDFYYNYSFVDRDTWNKDIGYSVRCLRD